MTTLVLLFILAVVWAIYLVSWARSRTEHRSVDSISSFSKHLSVLERTSPGRTAGPTRLAGSPAPLRSSASLARPAFAPTVQGRTGSGGLVLSRHQARERRKNVLFGLAGAALVTLAMAVLVGGPLLYLHLVADVLLGAYVLLLVQTQRWAYERQTTVHYLQQPQVEYYDSPMLLQSSAR